MFTDINNALNINTDFLSNPCLIGIGENGADCSFLIHHFISLYLKNGVTVVLISFKQALNHFNGVGAKIGCNLLKFKEQNRFGYVDGLRNLSQCVNNGIGNAAYSWTNCVNDVGHIDSMALMKEIIFHMSSITEKMQEPGAMTLIIDNITPLLDVGMTPTEVTKLIQYLKAHIENDIRGNFVVGCYSDKIDEEGSTLSKYIHHSADLFLEVKGLETGYCKDVHGQLLAHWPQGYLREKAVTKSWQYKLTDKTCALFAAGMSSAVL
ncbi:ELP6-like protein [Mya arenaria]|uniref:Elongator complex protein 6 n=1 Tax=Mya arenaria TaxID=6604 RepID=A0ABY7DHR3_MYAAR|nr:elongator complex protein 6-like [Mya arenaria]WAQ97229.1 ELP6-like protein [Mya arenaria]